MKNQNLEASPSVFHEGEIKMQESIGVGERLEELGKRMIRDHMPDQHRDFFAQLSMIHIGITDKTGHPYALIRTGKPGFIESPDANTLIINSEPIAGEPEELIIEPGAKISIVGVEFESRRRNRLNATITSCQDNRLEMRVDQSYGNCPKYIQIREMSSVANLDAAHKTEESTIINDTLKSIIDNADTLFIASRAPVLDDDPKAGVDINHRGGNPGFIEIIDDQTIMIPDYTGNNFFNTYGNILLDNRVGLQIMDFENSSVLNVEGRAEIIMLDGEFDGLPDLGRRLKVKIEKTRLTTQAIPFKADFVAWSPMLPGR